MIRQFQTICIVPTWQAKHAKNINMQSCKTAYFSRIDKLLSMTWKFYTNIQVIGFGSNQPISILLHIYFKSGYGVSLFGRSKFVSV